MNLRHFHKIGQAALEFILVLTVVAIIVFLAIKPSSTTPSALNRAQAASEEYYNTVTEVIMGRNPKPIDGQWCPPKPSGERECACPQPAFGGKPCAAPDPNIQYCGNGVCDAGETGEPGHPINSSDSLITCLEDCDYLPDCDQCANLIPSAGCADTCGGNTCTGLQVCMTSDCAPGCAGYRTVCQDNPQLCSGSCRCNPDPGTRTEVSGCGIQFGACKPSIYEKCFQFNDCTSSCTADQRLQAVRVPECGKCPAQTYPVNCGPTGSVTIPETLNGQTGSVACPFGCTQRTMSALCTDGVFGVPSSPCIPAICEPLVYNTGICGNVTLPVTSPGMSTPPVLCDPRCDGTITGTCPSGTATFIVSGVCVPGNCVSMSYNTINCGPTTLPGVNHGQTSSVACPAGCTGPNITAVCDRRQFSTPQDMCMRDCPALPGVPAGACGTVTLPGRSHGQTSSATCPGACTGSITAVCNNGTFDPPTSGCVPNCSDLTGVSAGACGAATIPGTTSGQESSVACPGGCSGRLRATCTNGTFGPVTNECGCPDTIVGTTCGATTLPAAANGATSPGTCPGTCVGSVSAVCASGTFGPLTGQCLATCPLTPVTTACGSANLPAGVVSGNSGTVACPTGCSGAGVSATCNNGVYGPPTIACTANPCAGITVTTPCGPVDLPGVPSGIDTPRVGCPSGCSGVLLGSCSMGNMTVTGTCTPNPCPTRTITTTCLGSVTMNGVASGATGTASCQPGCVGSITSTCTNGVWGPNSGSCSPAPCPSTPVTTPACGVRNLPPANHGEVKDVTCTGGCTGQIHGTCLFGQYQGVNPNGCVRSGCDPLLLNPPGCGLVSLPSVSNGNTSQVGCPGGCLGGPLSATCSNGTFGPISGTCTPPASCLTSSLPVSNNPRCPNVLIPTTISGNLSTGFCTGTCIGQASALCTNGVWGAATGCTYIPACGNGFLDAGEQCDPPSGTVRNTSCAGSPQFYCLIPGCTVEACCGSQPC